MPPRKERKEHSDTEWEDLCKLNNEYKIQFLGPATDIDWEREGLPYKGLFEQISSIQNIKFADYPSRKNPDPEGAYQKKLLARKIQANAARCKRERDNEAGWINNVANLVFGHLDGVELRW